MVDFFIKKMVVGILIIDCKAGAWIKCIGKGGR